MRGGYIVARGTHEGIYSFSGDFDHSTRYRLETNCLPRPGAGDLVKEAKKMRAHPT